MSTIDHALFTAVSKTKILANVALTFEWQIDDRHKATKCRGFCDENKTS